MPEGEEPDCAEQASSLHAIDPADASEPKAEAANKDSPHALKAAETKSAQGSDAASHAKPAKRVKSKKARSRPLRSFLREVDLLPYRR